MLRPKLDQRLPRCSRGLRQIAMIEIRWMRLAARGHALVRSNRGLGVNEVDAIEAYAQLFGDELNLRRANSLPDFRFAGVRGYAAARACAPGPLWPGRAVPPSVTVTAGPGAPFGYPEPLGAGFGLAQARRRPV